jgi:hypothetical protein
MKLDETLKHVATLIRQSGHPEITTVTVLDRAVQVDMRDGSTNYVKVPHMAAAGARTPERPSWPGYDLPAKGAGR